MLQRTIFWMASWGATIRLIVVMVYTAADWFLHIGGKWESLFAAAYAPEYRLDTTLSKILCDVNPFVVFVVILLLSWIGTFLLVWLLLQIAALFVRPRRDTESPGTSPPTSGTMGM